MNEELNSEAKFLQLDTHFGPANTRLQTQDNFSDLVPSIVTVESILNTGRYSLNQINPMTASYYTDNAVVMNPRTEFFSLKRPG